MSAGDGGSRTDEKKTARLRRSGEPPRPAPPDSGLVPVDATLPPESELHLDADEQTRYLLRGTIGQGGMGEVRRARDVRIGREVAMKIAHSREANSLPLAEQRLRFLREARIQGQLEHPAVVPVYDLGRSADDGLYFTMKRVRGATLQEIIERLARGDEAAAARYNRRKLLTAFSSVCLAMDYAHARGVVHRDLKPANIMLGDFGEVYILDWGLARISGVPETSRAHHHKMERGDPTPIVDPMAGSRPTIFGEVLGTPGYMPPEQARGDNERLDGRADVYALGVILFELLTLEPLHAQTADVNQVLFDTQMGMEDRVAEGARACEVPPELEAVCLRALKSDPEDRYASARELCEAVEGYLDGDRDLELRRDLAQIYAERACDMAEQTIEVQAAGGAAIEPRRAALREVGRALALDPGHSGALGALSRLLETPPRELPPGVVLESNAFAREEQQVLGRLGVYSYFSFFLYAPLALLGMGARNWTVLLLGTGLWIAAAFGHLQRYRHPHPGGRIAPWLVVLSSAAVFMLSTVLGSHLVVPTVAAVHGVTYLLGRDRSVRRLVWGASVLIVLLPVALEALGWWPEHYRFQDGVITVLPDALHFTPMATRAFLVVVDLGMVLTACMMVGGMRDALSAAEQRMQLYAWQLRQLVPVEPSAGRSVRRVRRAPEAMRRDLG